MMLGTVTAIGDYAFYECKNLESATFPGSLLSIGDRAFSLCKKLKSLTIPDSVTKIGESAFSGCMSITSVTIPHAMTELSSSIFNMCTNLTSVVISKSITRIGTWAFNGCSSLEDVRSEATVPPTCDDYVFGGVPIEDCILYVPEGSIEDYRTAEQWKDFLNIGKLDDFNEVTSVTCDDVSISICDNVVSVSGKDETYLVRCYNLNGECFKDTSASEFTLEHNGVVIIKVGNRTYKAYIR